MHVGSAYSSTTQSYGLSILFSAPLARGQDWNRLIQLSNSQGESVRSDWRYSGNPRGIYIAQLPAGRYRITMEPRISDNQGRMLEMFLQGWVTIP